VWGMAISKSLGSLLVTREGEVCMKDDDHHMRHPRGHLGDRTSAEGTRGCAWRDDQFGRWENPVLGSQESKPAFEALIGSPEAAKLLGNIHVKTLQRYARTGSLPGYQIGGHWYFRVSELDAWLQSRINSNCQPADRVDFTQEKTQ